MKAADPVLSPWSVEVCNHGKRQSPTAIATSLLTELVTTAEVKSSQGHDGTMPICPPQTVSPEGPRSL